MTHTFGLKPKITIAVSVLFIFLMSAVAYVMFSYFEKQLKTTIAQNQFVMATGLAGEIDNRLTIFQSQLAAAALTIPPAAFSDPDRAQAFLDSMLGLRRIFDGHVSIITPEGTILAETPFVPGRRGFDISFRPYYKDTVATLAPVISEPYFSSQDHKNPLVRMTAPVFNEKGSLVGILSGAINLMGENILRDLSHITIGRTGYLFLITRDSRLMIMHPDAKRILTPLPPGINLLFDKAVDGFEGTDETVNSYGVRMLTSFKRLAVNNWILGANYPVSEAHEIIRDLKEKFLVAMGIGIICVVSIVFFLIKHLTSPLVALTRHIETLHAKTGAAKLIALRTGDEIGTLSQAFNRMIGDLDQQKDKLLQSQKMAAVGVLAGGIAHDFNNILSAILGFTELVKNNNPANQQLQEDLDEVYTAGNRAKELVQQILIFSRKKEHNPHPLHVPTFAKEALKLLRSTLSASIEMKVDINESVSPVLADPTQIHQIVMNLCTNAGQAMGDGGGILTIQVSETTPSDQFFRSHPNLVRGSYIKLVVEDTGSGITPEIMGSIFDPYFTTKNYGDGTGLGLAVTYGIIEEIGGNITAASEPGKGSIFTVLLPVSTQEVNDSDIFYGEDDACKTSDCR